jgi:hypothetical protein
MRIEYDDHEFVQRAIFVAQSKIARAGEPESLVESRFSQDYDERNAVPFADVQAVAHEAAADPLALVLRKDRQRT